MFSLSMFLSGCGIRSNLSEYKKAGDGAVGCGYNVIFILLDSVRADHLSCYGYKRNTSPSIDKLASEGVIFKQAVSQSTWSLPDFCSLFTSRYVINHKVDEIDKRLKDSELTLAEILKIYGYQTVAFTGGFWLSSVFNINQGFDMYVEEQLFGKLTDTASLAVSWLEKNKERRFFLLLQGFDGHSPFTAPLMYRSMYVDSKYEGVFKNIILDHRVGDRIAGNRFFLDYDFKNSVEIHYEDIRHIIDLYDAEIRYADSAIGEFLNKLDELGISDNTIVVLTSSHGVPLFEHGIILRRKHGGPTEDIIRVPLIIRHPAFKEGIRNTISSQVQHIDVMPTILDFLEIPINHQAQGVSLFPLIKGKRGRITNQYACISGYKEIAIRTASWKLINMFEAGERYELYDLKQLPIEQENLILQRADISDVFKQRLNLFLRKAGNDSEECEMIPEYKIEEMRENMKRNGYWFLEVSRHNEIIGRQKKHGWQ